MQRLPAFQNEPSTDFSTPTNRRAMEEALAKVRAQFGREYDLLIGGEHLKTGDLLRSVNPSNPKEVVGVHHRATADLARRAVDSAYAYFPEWSVKPEADRIGFLLRAAAIIRQRKLEFDAWLVLEAGKTWPEADADVSEAIDFCEYYAREMQRFSGPLKPDVQLPGERGELRYLPLGVGVIIPPWNFPLAIMVGMTVASLVAGNTAIIKPSSETPTIGAKFAEVLLEAGFPDKSFCLLTGSGAAVGDVIVEHPKTRFVAFTGSRDVGLRINELAAKTQPGQIWIKRVIAEMGGKDAIVVDADCDLDKAVEGVAVSAFGYSGQKCSACSRAIVDAKVYDAFLEKLQARVSQITVGDAAKPENYMGPVISEGARRTIVQYIETGKKEGRLLARFSDGAQRGVFRAAHGYRGCGCQGAHFPGGDFRTGAGGDQSARFRPRHGAGQRLAIRPDRRHLFQRAGTHRACPAAVLRWQSVREPQMHRCHGWRAPIRRLQYVGHRFERRRSGLHAAVFAGEVHRRACGVNGSGKHSPAANRFLALEDMRVGRPGRQSNSVYT